MDTPIESSTFDPLSATLWRKLLGLRVIAANAAAFSLMMLAISWVDETKVLSGFPKWATTFAIMPFALHAVGMIYYVLPRAITDLVIHFIKEGRLKQLMLRGGDDETVESMAGELEKTGYLLAVAPLGFVAALVGIGLLILLVVGGFTLVIGAVSSFFSGWPSWSVAIFIVLVLILLKK